jgi:hypothetical protein
LPGLFDAVAHNNVSALKQLDDQTHRIVYNGCQEKRMTVQLDLDLAQVKKLVDRLPKKEKMTLARYPDEQTLFEEMR